MWPRPLRALKKEIDINITKYFLFMSAPQQQMCRVMLSLYVLPANFSTTELRPESRIDH